MYWNRNKRDIYIYIYCPLQGKCWTNSVVYKAEVSSEDKKATYIGAAANFKERYRNHVLSFKHLKYQNNTNLSTYVWSLKAENKPFNIQWSIAGNAPSYNPSFKSCKLCLLEKTLIMKSIDPIQLNKRTELMSKCRHRAKFLLSNIAWYCIKFSIFFKFSSFQLFQYFLNTFSVPVNYAKIKKKIRKIQFDFNCATEECVQHET